MLESTRSAAERPANRTVNSEPAALPAASVLDFFLQCLTDHVVVSPAPDDNWITQPLQDDKTVVLGL